MKGNARYEVIEERPVPQYRRILKDQIIRLIGVGAEERCPHPLRRIEMDNPEKEEILVFLTNHLGFGASTVAAIYKDRWQIELFFKTLKQHLQDQNLRGHLGQRGQDPGLDGSHCHAAAAVPITEVEVGQVALGPGGPAADEPLYLSGPVELGA